MSILSDTKKVLGIDSAYTAFDVDIIMHINSVFSTLNELGIGPSHGFMIYDNTATWDDFLFNDPRLNSVKSYVYLRVRLLFDPPTTSYLMQAMQEQVKELEWRLNVVRENLLEPVVVAPGDGGSVDGNVDINVSVIDGGTA